MRAQSPATRVPRVFGRPVGPTPWFVVLLGAGAALIVGAASIPVGAGAGFQAQLPLQMALAAVAVAASAYGLRRRDRHRIKATATADDACAPAGLDAPAAPVVPVTPETPVTLPTIESRLAQLLEDLPATVYLDRYRSEDGAFLAVEYVSPHMETLTGYPPQAFVDDPELWSRLIHPADLERVSAEHMGRRDNTRPLEREYRLRRRDGSIMWVREEARLIESDQPGTLLAHGVLTDITERKRLQAELSVLAFHDALTGLANRTQFENRLETLLANRDRTGALAVLFMDLDGFKSVNDSLGHAAGDRLLRFVARRLTGATRAGDMLARLGGDEFGILLEVAHAEDAAAATERLLHALRDPIDLNGRRVTVRASVGIAMAGVHGAAATDLLRSADAAMYRAKEARRGSWVMFDPDMHADAVARFELETDLRLALAREELYLVYQPIHSLADDRTVGVEVLLRWMHPARGSVPPATFIPIAEASELIHELGAWVLERACAQVASWIRGGFVDHDFMLSVNVSARELIESKASDVAAALARTGLPACNLTVEVTETAIVHDLASAVAVLDGIRALGVSVAMDDFGTGYSSLANLQRLPIDAIKIDRSFIGGLDRAYEGALIRAVVQLALALDLRTVAEGVESAAHAASLAELGCDLGQGYYFGAPMAPEELVRRLGRRGAA